MNFDYRTFLSYHESQLSGNSVPEQYWPVIYRKIVDQKLDLPEFFAVEQVFQNAEDSSVDVDSDLYELGFRRVVADENIDVDDAFNVFLSAHIFTFEFTERHRKLKDNPEMLERLLAIFQLKSASIAKEDDHQVREKCVDRSLFKFASNFSLDVDGCGKICKTFWYVLDEFGSAIQHSFEPNMKCLPFVNVLNGQCFNLLWPLKNISKGEIVMRNTIDPFKPNDRCNQDLLSAMMIPWKNATLRHVPCDDLKENKDLFVFKYKPEDILTKVSSSRKRISKSRKLKVYSEYIYITKFLNDPNYLHINERSKADILWLLTPFYDYKQLSTQQPNTYINQFPFESVLTLKDLFSHISRRSKAVPKWSVQTFDLQNELTAFVSYYQKLEAQGQDNKWIIKPWNLSRSMEAIITEDLVQIIKLRNSIPKIVSKYIQSPVLFYRDDIGASVKFDLRFIVLLKSVSPLKVYIYKNFWIRFANKPFDLDDLDDYQKHFTVMNYVEKKQQDEREVIKQIQWQQFVKAFNEQQVNGKENQEDTWSHVQDRIYSSIKDCFECAVSENPPYGIGDNCQSRALYGIDVMLRNEEDSCIQPTILEVNYAPDCKRACEYYPDFYNNIFNVLFRDHKSDDIVEL